MRRPFNQPSTFQRHARGSPPAAPPQLPPTPSRAGSTSLLTGALQYATIVAGVAYIGGWVYLQRYFSHFYIDLAQLELGWYDIVIQSVSLLSDLGNVVFRSNWLVLFVFAIPAALLLIERQRGFLGGMLAELGTLNNRFYLPSLLILLLLIAYVAWAKSLADDQARKKWAADQADEEIQFELKSDCAPKQSSITDLALHNERGSLRLLRATPKAFFVFARTTEPDSGRHPMIRMLQVPASCVLVATTSLRDKSP